MLLAKTRTFVSFFEFSYFAILTFVFLRSLLDVWGFDPDACRALADLQRQASKQERENLGKQSFKRYIDFLKVSDKETKSVDSPELITSVESMSVTNRVAGFTCLAILAEHIDCVTSLAVVPHSDGFGSTFLLSGGWDRTICIWNIEQFM